MVMQRLSRAVGLLLLVMGIAVTAASAATPADQIARAVEEIYARDGLQRALPTQQPEPSERRPSAAERPLPPESSVELPAGEFSGAARLIFWLLLATGLLLLVLFLAKNASDFQWASKPAAGDERERERASGQPSAGAARDDMLAEADRLAGQGAFSEAVHLLLLASLDSLRRRSGLALAESLTSRELLTHLQLPADAASAFRALVGTVEISLFGGKPIGAADFRSCQKHYLQLTAIAASKPS